MWRFVALVSLPLFPNSRLLPLLKLRFHSPVRDRVDPFSLVYIGGAGVLEFRNGRDELGGSAATGTGDLLGRTCDLSTAGELVKDAN